MPSNLGFLRRLWKRAILRTIKFADARRRLELLYYLGDPWCMESASEQHRFLKTCDFLQRQVGPINSLLEIGCGEGHQTNAFKKIANNILAIDVSRSAIARAIVRCPDVEFAVGDVASRDWLALREPFDVVTACEVLYYIRDVQSTLTAIELICCSVLVSYVDEFKSALDPLILSKPGVVVETIEFRGTKWTCAFWKAQRPVKPNGSGPNHDRPC